MILLIDNYDSFSYNLYQLIGEITQDITVSRNDKITLAEIHEMNPEAIILSPGPGKPENAGICVAFGGVVSYAKRLMHGKSSIIELDDDLIFECLDSKISVGRYHSLSLIEDSLPYDLKVISKSCDDGEIMAVKHKKYKVYGLQFHPESILTPDGLTIIKNFCEGI